MRSRRSAAVKLAFEELIEKADESERKIILRSFIATFIERQLGDREKLSLSFSVLSSRALSFFMFCALRCGIYGLLDASDAAQIIITGIHIIWGKGLSEDLILRQTIFCDMQSLPGKILKKYQHELPPLFNSITPRVNELKLKHGCVFWRQGSVDVATAAAAHAQKPYGFVEQICEHLSIGAPDNIALARRLIDEHHLDFQPMDKFKIVEGIIASKLSPDEKAKLRGALVLPKALQGFC